MNSSDLLSDYQIYRSDHVSEITD